MIFKSSFPNSPNVYMSIDGVPVDYTSIESVEVSFSENEHDYACFTFVGLMGDAVTDYLDRPVFISIQVSPTQSTTFHGYVGYIEPEAVARRGYINKSLIQKAHIHCFGASYDMKQKNNRVWDKYTLSKLVEELAEKYGYSCETPTDSFIIPRIVQNNESDWEVLVKACHMMGYKVTATSAHIHVYDPSKILSRAMPYAELTTLLDDTANVDYAPGRIMEFMGTFGKVTPEGSANAFNFQSLSNDGVLVSHITDETESMQLGQVVSPRFTDTVTMNAVSKKSVERYARSAVNNRAPFHASVVVTGLPEVIPGSLINLKKYDAKFDGFWMVQSVNHKVTRSNYITSLKILRDSTNEAPPVLTGGDKYSPSEEPRIVQGTWRSRNQSKIIYR